jgi:glycosyltransferase involved in cell wall biosynthesis
MKKVMMYCHAFYPLNTGYANAFLNLVNSILDHDLDIHITVVTPIALSQDIQELKRDRLTIQRLIPFTKLRVLRFFTNDYFFANNVSKKFMEEGFQLLLVETFDQPNFINSLNRVVLKKTAVRVHATSETEYTVFSRSLKYRIRKFLIKYLTIKKVRWILSTNAYHIDFVKKYYLNENVIDISDKFFSVVPNPVNLIPPADLKLNEKLKVIVLGRMEYLGYNQKGFADLICALRLLPVESLHRFEIKIIGSGPMRAELISQSSGLTNVEFIEELSHAEIIGELQKSDMVILPSRYEGLSMFALEGLATGNICVFSNTGGLTDMIDDNGILFEPQNIEALSSALLDLSNMEEDRLVSMKNTSVRISEIKFSPKAVAKKFGAVYDTITGHER